MISLLMPIFAFLVFSPELRLLAESQTPEKLQSIHKTCLPCEVTENYEFLYRRQYRGQHYDRSIAFSTAGKCEYDRTSDSWCKLSTSQTHTRTCQTNCERKVSRNYAYNRFFDNFLYDRSAEYESPGRCLEAKDLDSWCSNIQNYPPSFRAENLVTGLTRSTEKLLAELEVTLCENIDASGSFQANRAPTLSKWSQWVAVFSQGVFEHESSSAWKNCSLAVRDHALESSKILSNLDSSNFIAGFKEACSEIRLAKTATGNNCDSENRNLAPYSQLVSLENAMSLFNENNGKFRRLARSSIDITAETFEDLAEVIVMSRAVLEHPTPYVLEDKARTEDWRKMTRSFADSFAEGFDELRTNRKEKFSEKYLNASKFCTSCHDKYRDL